MHLENLERMNINLLTGLTIISFFLNSCSKSDPNTIKPDDIYIPYNGRNWKLLPSSYNGNCLYTNIKIIENKLYCAGYNSFLILDKNNTIISEEHFNEPSLAYTYLNFNKDYLIYSVLNQSFIVRKIGNITKELKVPLLQIDTNYYFIYDNFIHTLINNQNQVIIQSGNYGINSKIKTYQIKFENNSIKMDSIPSIPEYNNLSNYVWYKETKNGKYFASLSNTLFYDFNNFQILNFKPNEIIGDYFGKDTAIYVSNENNEILITEFIKGALSATYHSTFRMGNPCEIYKNYLIFSQFQNIYITDYTNNKVGNIKYDYPEYIFDMIIYDGKLYLASSSGIVYIYLKDLGL